MKEWCKLFSKFAPISKRIENITNTKTRLIFTHSGLQPKYICTILIRVLMEGGGYPLPLGYFGDKIKTASYSAVILSLHFP